MELQPRFRPPTHIVVLGRGLEPGPQPPSLLNPERASPRGSLYRANAFGLLLVSGVDGDLVCQIVGLLNCRVNLYIADDRRGKNLGYIVA